MIIKSYVFKSYLDILYRRYLLVSVLYLHSCYSTFVLIYIYNYYDNGNESSQFPSTNEGIFLVCFQFQVYVSRVFKVFSKSRAAPPP